MENIKRIISWMVYSSKDMDKLSTTVKGILTGVVTLLTFYLGVQDIVVDPNLFTGLIDSVIALLQALGVVVGSVATVYGFIRKIALTATGRHPLGSIIK